MKVPWKASWVWNYEELVKPPEKERECLCFRKEDCEAHRYENDQGNIERADVN